MNISDRLKRCTESQGIKQVYLARELQISLSTLNGYFTGYREPDAAMIVTLAQKLKIFTDYLLTGEEPQQKKPPAEAEGEVNLLTDNEREVLTRYRAAPPSLQAVVLAALEAQE